METQGVLAPVTEWHSLWRHVMGIRKKNPISYLLDPFSQQAGRPFASTWLDQSPWLGCDLGRWAGLNPVNKRLICLPYFSEKEPSGDSWISGWSGAWWTGSASPPLHLYFICFSEVAFSCCFIFTAFIKSFTWVFSLEPSIYFNYLNLEIFGTFKPTFSFP